MKSIAKTFFKSVVRCALEIAYLLASALVLFYLINRVVFLGGYLAKYFMQNQNPDEIFYFFFLDGAFSAGLVSALLVVYLLRYNYFKWRLVAAFRYFKEISINEWRKQSKREPKQFMKFKKFSSKSGQEK